MVWMEFSIFKDIPKKLQSFVKINTVYLAIHIVLKYNSYRSEVHGITFYINFQLS